MQNLLDGIYIHKYLKFIDEWLNTHDRIYLYTRKNPQGNPYYYFCVKKINGETYQRSINSPEAPALMLLYKEQQFYLRAKKGLMSGNTAEFDKLFALMESSADIGMGQVGRSVEGIQPTMQSKGKIIISAGTSGDAVKPFAAKMTKDLFWKLKPANDQNVERGITHGKYVVRSKAEDDIATILDEYYMPYVYEPLIKIQNFELKPDFAFFVPFLNMFFFLEHLGKIDDEQYLISAMRKIADYCRVGIWPGINLLLTSEVGSAPASIEMLKSDILSFVCTKIM